MPGFKEQKSFGYTDLMLPLQALNIIYPHDDLASFASTLEPIKYSNKLAENEDENSDDIAPSKADTADLIEEINEGILSFKEISLYCKHYGVDKTRFKENQKGFGVFSDNGNGNQMKRFTIIIEDLDVE